MKLEILNVELWENVSYYLHHNLKLVYNLKMFCKSLNSLNPSGKYDNQSAIVKCKNIFCCI